MASGKSTSDGNEPSGAFSYVRSFLASGLASCCAATSVAPLERLKILFQGQHPHYQSMGMRAGLRRIYKDEGIRGFYRGNGATMIYTFPYSVVQFTTFDETKKFIQKKKGEVNHIDRLVAATFSGVSATVAAYPMELVRTRLMFQTKGQETYSGYYDSIRSISAKEGLRGFYRGLTPSLMGGTPYAAISYFSFDTLRNMALKIAPKYCAKQSEHHPGKIILNTPANMICGSLSGAITQTVVYPLDVLSNQMQVEAMCDNGVGPAKSMFQKFKNIYEEHGIARGLYRGLTVSLLRAIPSSTVFFTAHEVLRQIMGLD